MAGILYLKRSFPELIFVIRLIKINDLIDMPHFHSGRHFLYLIINPAAMNNPLEKLLNYSGRICLSVISTTYKKSPARKKNYILIKQLVKEAEGLLDSKHLEDPNSKSIRRSLDKLVNEIDYNHLQQGIGLFISHDLAEMVSFPFSVTSKVHVGTKFLMRDLFYLLQTEKEFLVINVGKNTVRVFRGKGNSLDEIINENLPLTFEDSYEYSRSVRGTSYGLNAGKGFEKDKSILQQIRMKDFYKNADRQVHDYITDNMPVFLFGDQKEVNAYFDISRHKEKIADKVIGRYKLNGNNQLKSIAEKTMKNHRFAQNIKIAEQLKEIPAQQLASGTPEVWRNSVEGRGLVLFVEKDFSGSGWLPDDFKRLNQTASAGNNHYINDIVEEIIQMVKAKGGEIAFVENGNLEDFGGIALRKRF